MNALTPPRRPVPRHPPAAPENAADARVPTAHVEHVRIVKAAHQSGAESAPQRFKRLVRDMDAARDARAGAAPTGTLSLWKRQPA